MDIGFDLQELIRRMPGNIYWKDKDGYYHGCNENVAKILGFSSPNGIVGKTLYDFFSEEMAQAHDKNDQYVLQNGRELIIEEHSIGLDHKPAVYLSRKIPLFNEAGDVYGLLGISTDITQYKKRETALVSARDKAEENLAKIVSFLPGNIFWKDEKLRYLGCNENLAKVYGLQTPDEIVGKKNADINAIDKNIAMIAEQNDEMVMRTGKEMIFEEQGQDADGNEATYLSRKIPLFEEGVVKGTLGVSLDITQRKRQEQELNEAKQLAVEANQAKTDFLMNMSHDIKTPLAGVIGFLDILMRKETDESKKEMLGYAYSSSQKLLRIINDVFDVVSEGKQSVLSKDVIDFRAMLTDNCDLLMPEILQKNLELQVNIDPALPAKIISDKMRLNKILLNLMTNAVKFTDKGFINVFVNLLDKKEDTIKYEVRIEDSGCGISAENIPKIFEQFSRIDTEQTRNKTGSGLGLWFVKNIVESLGGEIKVDSKVGEGTIFRVTLTAELVKSVVEV